ncbi:hypothetical protein B9Z19DRAFT_486721 [Tuber borchii]|uniref:Uncharacterized protein n=1 Tax=Tuber borchii TaxID=42251 RepID=A0A2T6ZEY0_TUBBO|nr:hypothetical protein B9Z19DRAFT_486721 [Tuber borchii]
MFCLPRVANWPLKVNSLNSPRNCWRSTTFMGEVMHNIRLGSKCNCTLFNNPLDENLYGSPLFYYEHRYITLKDDLKKGYAYGVYPRNLHGQGILLCEKSLTWRIIGGMVHLTFYSGPTPADVLPIM